MIKHVQGFKPPTTTLEDWRTSLYATQRDTLAVFPDCAEPELRYLFTISLDAIERILAMGAISAVEAEQLRTEVIDAYDALQPPGTPSSRGLDRKSFN